MNGGIGFCVYITPCGYCNKFDKWCEEKCRGKRVKINPVDDKNKVMDRIKSGMGLICNKGDFLMKMDYYAYEYSVIKKLMDILKVESVDYEKEVEDIRKTVRENGELINKKILEYITKCYIKFNFEKGSCYYINRKNIINAFNNNIDIETIVDIIRKDVLDNQLLKEIYIDS